MDARTDLDIRKDELIAEAKMEFGDFPELLALKTLYKVKGNVRRHLIERSTKNTELLMQLLKDRILLMQEITSRENSPRTITIN